MNILINDTNTCWVCGKDNKVITGHHALPKHLNPVNNIIIPVCEGCHNRINADDINGMYAYLHKINNIIKNNNQMIKIAFGKINNMNNVKLQKSEEDSEIN